MEEIRPRPHVRKSICTKLHGSAPIFEAVAVAQILHNSDLHTHVLLSFPVKRQRIEVVEDGINCQLNPKPKPIHPKPYTAKA